MKTAILCVAVMLGLATAAEAEIRVGHGLSARSIARAAYYGGRYGGYQRSVYVQPYYRSNGTYVQQHYRSYPDGNFYNNWSTYPNVNPYTGRRGTRYYPQQNYGWRRW